MFNAPVAPFIYYRRTLAMIQTFEQTIDGKPVQFCASIADGGSPQRVIISRADSAKSLVIVEASGIIGAIKAELEEPETFVANAVRKAQGATGRTDRTRARNGRSADYDALISQHPPGLKTDTVHDLNAVPPCCI